MRIRRPGWAIALVTGLIALGVVAYLRHNAKHVDVASAIVGAVLAVVGLGLTVYGIVPKRHDPPEPPHITEQKVVGSVVNGPVTQIAHAPHRRRRDG